MVTGNILHLMLGFCRGGGYWGGGGENGGGGDFICCFGVVVF